MLRYSVLMTVFKNDNPKFFREALQSIIYQTSAPNEIVIVKDGPITQVLQEVIDSVMLEQYVNVVQVQLDKNVGLGLALNAGIQIAKNDYLARMDADDISCPERCEKEMAEFEADPNLDIVGCPVLEFSGCTANIVGKRDVPKSNEEIHQFVRRRDPFNHPTVIIKKDSLVHCGGYSNYRKNQDTDLWLRMLNSGCKGKNLQEALLYFRFDESTYRKRKNWKNTKTLLEIRRRALKNGYCSLADYLCVAVAQTGMFLMPLNLQHWVYKTFLRK